MTLVAGFRSRNGGILLCADREEGDGYSKRAVEKICAIPLKQCKLFIAGAGSSAVITKACVQFTEALRLAEENGADLATEHQTILEECLENVYERYVKSPAEEIGLLIVAAFHKFGDPSPPAPRLYRTEGAMLLPESIYAAQGTGKVISDYLADRLYKYGLERIPLTLLAAFIFREAGNASSGVGLGTDMMLIFDGDRSMRIMGPDAVSEIEAGIPALADSIAAHWSGHLTAPEWLIDKPSTSS